MPLIGTLIAAATLASSADVQFSAHRALAHVNIDVQIGTLEASGSQPIYWIRRTIQRPHAKIEKSQTNTQSCPRMLAALRALRELPMPRPTFPYLDDDQLIVTADGTSYSLTVSAAYPNAGLGDLTLNSNVDTPLAAWVDDALATLDSCMPK